ncbi:MAG: hypothetical protein AAF599_03160, partial [Bacteroidota bacterium]
EQQAADLKGNKDAEGISKGISSFSRLCQEIFDKCMPKRKKSFDNKFLHLILRSRSVLLLLFNSVKIAFLVLLAGVIKYDIMLCMAPASETMKEALRIFELKLTAFISFSLMSAIALEISTLGKDFFSSPGGWIDLFIILPVIVGSWAYSIWHVRTAEAGEEQPIRHLAIQLGIIIPAKLFLLANRLMRVMNGRPKGDKSLREQIIDYLKEQREEKKQGIVQRIDVLWAVRPGLDDDWFREEARKLSGKRVRFIPFYPRGIEEEDEGKVVKLYE